MKKQHVRISFVFVFLSLCFTYIFSIKIKEPFPAIMMPRFSSQMINDGRVTFSDCTLIITSSDSVQFNATKHQLLEYMHLPQRNIVMSRVFSPKSQVAIDQNLNTWLKSVCQKIAKSEDIAKLDVKWSNYDAKFGHKSKPLKKEFIGKRTIIF